MKGLPWEAVAARGDRTYRRGSKMREDLFGGTDAFDTRSPFGSSGKHARIAVRDNDIVLDFFAGSCTTAQAVMEFNKAKSRSCKFIMVQLPEPIVRNPRCSRNPSKPWQISVKSVSEKLRRSSPKTLLSRSVCFRSRRKTTASRSSSCRSLTSSHGMETRQTQSKWRPNSSYMRII